jgi:protein-S-isoprenylcysteine O-methyltransferase Ste14
MKPEIIVSIVAAVVWIAVEAYLILRDRAGGKGPTTLDRRTRNYNTISMLLALCLSPVICSLPAFRFAGFQAPIAFWAGIVTMCFGFLLRHWSIYILGKYFRTTVELERDHKVVRTGPYRTIRHPSYSGMILFCIGYGLLAQNWLSLIVAVLFPTVSLLYRINIEEAALKQGIGAEYEEYQKETKKLIPMIW